MPVPEKASRNQYAVLWVKTGDDEFGEPILASPIELLVRWVDDYREVVNAAGELIALKVSLITDRLIPIGSIMWLGRLEDWYGVGSAGDDKELHQVQTTGRAPDVKNRRDVRNRVVQYSAGLDRFKGSLPVP